MHTAQLNFVPVAMLLVFQHAKLVAVDSCVKSSENRHWPRSSQWLYLQSIDQQ